MLYFLPSFFSILRELTILKQRVATRFYGCNPQLFSVLGYYRRALIAFDSSS